VISIRSDLLKKPFQSCAENNKDKFVEIAHEVIKEEEKMNHHLLAKDLKKLYILIYKINLMLIIIFIKNIKQTYQFL